MNENYLERYVTIDGNVNTRNKFEKYRMVPFAGSKFLFDRIVAIIGLIVLFPIMLIIGIAIKIDSKGPILFKQLRTGKNGKPFYMYKFRSMVVENDVHDFTTADRHTKVGNFLRKTSLDELPQLISIADGKMSFIGPRPWIPDYFNNMDEIQKHRCCVRPGLTGLAQCNGRNAITVFDRIKYDLEYVANYSLKQDIKIIFLTVKTVFNEKSADNGKGGIEKDLKDLKSNKGKYKNGKQVQK